MGIAVVLLSVEKKAVFPVLEDSRLPEDETLDDLSTLPTPDEATPLFILVALELTDSAEDPTVFACLGLFFLFRVVVILI